MLRHVINLRKHFEKEANPVYAKDMERYLRNLFPLFGIKSNPRKEISRSYFRANPITDLNDQATLIKLMYGEKEREFHYTALFICEKYIKKQKREYVSFLEYLITTNSWWDSVDGLSKIVGIHFQRFPELQIPYARKWINDDNFWLQRIAIIHQLSYKQDTNWPLLQEMILRRIESREFFVRKAIGWSLRQYAKFEQARVMSFVDEHNQKLSGLSKREALKGIK